MLKILVSISLLLNVLFIAALTWAVAQYGGFRAVLQKLMHPGAEVNYQNMKAMHAAYPVQEGAIVFLGNSLTEAGQWQEWFNSSKIYNRGIPGDHCDGMRQRLADALGKAPQAVFLMAGINDLAYHKPSVVKEKYEALIHELRKRYPACRLYLVSILPVNNKSWYVPIDNKAIVEMNAFIGNLAKKLKVPFVDLHSKMTDEEGQLRKALTVDGVHLTPAGYQLWLEELRPLVENELRSQQERETRYMK